MATDRGDGIFRVAALHKVHGPVEFPNLGPNGAVETDKLLLGDRIVTSELSQTALQAQRVSLSCHELVEVAAFQGDDVPTLAKRGVLNPGQQGLVQTANLQGVS